MTAPNHNAENDYYQGMEDAWAQSYPSTESVAEYEAFWTHIGGERPLGELMVEMLADIPRKTGRLLEFGCDNGILLHLMAASGFDRFGVDINADSLARGRELFPDLHLAKNDGTAIPHDDGHFDVIVASAVLKHIRPKDRPALYDEFARVGSHLLAVHEEQSTPEREVMGPFVFYRSDFAADLSERFTAVSEMRTAGYVFGLYRT